MTFNDFNLHKCADGLLPVIVQDANVGIYERKSIQ